MRYACVFLALVCAMLVVSNRVVAQAPPEPKLLVDLSLEPSGGTGTMFGPHNGLGIYFSEEGGDSLKIFGLGLWIGYLITRHVEVGIMVDVGVVSGSDNTTYMTDLRPFLKLNLWSTKHVNPFVQPFAGFITVGDSGESADMTAFDGGFYAGVDFLVTTWGIRLYTGFEALKKKGDEALFTVPIRWALVAYF